MSEKKDKQKIRSHVKLRLEKYPDWVSKEDIESGKVQPYEVIEKEYEIETERGDKNADDNCYEESVSTNGCR